MDTSRLSLDSRLLETFRAVAQAGKISAAARTLHLSQPAVTAQIRRLEEDVGRPLLVRTARGVELNEPGRILLGFAIRSGALLEEARGALRGAEPLGGELVIGASTTVAADVLPRLLETFFRAEGAGGVRLEVGNTGHVIEWVQRAAVPLGIVEGPSRASRVRLEPFLQDELLPAVAAEAPPSLASVRRPSDLERVPVIWREPGSGTRTVVERALRRLLGRPRRHHPGDLQLGSGEAIRHAVRLGLGVGFLSRWSLGPEPGRGGLRLLALKGLDARRDFSWALPAGELPGRAGRFLRHARRNPPEPFGRGSSALLFSRELG